MLREMAIADSYGAGFEFVKSYADHNLVNDFTFQQNPRYPELQAGLYTDDTMRAMALIRWMQSDAPYCGAKFVEGLLLGYKQDSRPGWSKRFQQFLEDHKNGRAEDLIMNVIAKDTNGALMGTPVLGYLFTTSQVKVMAGIQALTTHSAETVIHAQAMALSAHWFINGGDRLGLADFLLAELNYTNFTLSTDIKEMSARGTAGTVLWHLTNGPLSLSDLLHSIIEQKGDTDSIASLVIAIASQGDEFINDLPVEMYNNLEGGKHERLRMFEEMLTGPA